MKKQEKGGIVITVRSLYTMHSVSRIIKFQKSCKAFSVAARVGLRGKDWLEEIFSRICLKDGEMAIKQISGIRWIKTEKGVAALTLLIFVFQATMLGVFFSFAPVVSADDVCAIDVDAILIMDTSSSMADGESPGKCEWENLEWVQGEYGGTYMCVSHTEYGLTEEECHAKDDGRPQCDDIIYTFPKSNKITAAKAAAKSFVNNLKDADGSAVVSFNNTVSLNKALSADNIATNAAIDSLALGSAGADIGDAIGQGIDELNSERANPQAIKTMILLTDGKANKPNGNGYGEDARDVAYAEQKAREAAAAGYKIFTIGLGNGVNAAMLQNIATATDAKYYSVLDGSALDSVYNQIAGDICGYGSISGCKYQDTDNGGDIAGESKLAGWEIVLSGNAAASQLTDENGCYAFAGLLPGSYAVSEGANAAKQPYIQTYPADNFYNITLAEGQNINGIDFGNYLPSCGNNIKDENEACDGIDGIGEHQSCSADCQIINLPYCGDGNIDEGEICDDGNADNGDGCSAVCQIEPTPTPAPEITPTSTPTPTPEITPIPTIEPTPTLEITPTSTLEVTPTLEPTPTPTPAQEPTPTPEITPSPTPTPEITPALTPANTPSPTPTDTPSPMLTPSPTPTPEVTPTPTPAPASASGGGVAAFSDLTIGNETPAMVKNNAVTITWSTSHFSASQVIYDTASGKFDLNAGAPNYGYAYYKAGDDSGLEKATFHSVTLTDLLPGAAYYYRTVSLGSLAISQEHSFIAFGAASTAPAGVPTIAPPAAIPTSIPTPTPSTVQAPPYAGEIANLNSVPSSSSAETPVLNPLTNTFDYDGVSIVDYLKTIGQSSGFDYRARLAEQNEIKDYTGSAQQNLDLLGMLKNPVSQIIPSEEKILETQEKIESAEIEKVSGETLEEPLKEKDEFQDSLAMAATGSVTPYMVWEEINRSAFRSIAVALLLIALAVFLGKEFWDKIQKRKKA